MKKMSVENLNGPPDAMDKVKGLGGTKCYWATPSPTPVVPFALSLWSSLLCSMPALPAVLPLDSPPAPLRSKIWLPRALSFDTS